MICEVRQNILQNILISGGDIPDQSRADEILKKICENDLVPGDLGYFTPESPREIREKGAFFLSRLLKNAGVFLSPDADASPISLPGYVSKKFRHLSVADTDVWLGKEKLPCRLIAQRLPDEVARKRRGKARKKGRQPTKEYLGWLGFGFFITNVPREIWEPEIVGTVYRLRWNTELTSEYRKSLTDIHVLRGTRRERIECLLFGRLIAVAVVTMLCGFASWHCHKYSEKEASFHKIISWLIRKDRLADAVRSGSLGRLADELIKVLPKRLCKQKRKRRTTRQLLEERTPYMESFRTNSNILILLKK